MPISVPQGIEIEQKKNLVIVKGQRGILEQSIHPDMKIDIKDDTIFVQRPSESKYHKSLHGLT